MKLQQINWDLIARAIEHYERAGFKYVEVPWMVSYKAVSATLPEGKRAFLLSKVDDSGMFSKALVGSAEQSFLQMMIDSQLPPGRYVAASPCFRDDKVDELHQKQFFKVELIDVASRPITTEFMFGAAWDFLVGRHPELEWQLKSKKTDIGLDMELGGIEIGSYGSREHLGHRWTYGTGLAEPRFSQALTLSGVTVQLPIDITA